MPDPMLLLYLMGSTTCLENGFSSINWQLGPGLQVLALALLCAATVLVGRLQASSRPVRDWHSLSYDSDKATDPGFVWLGRCMAGAEAQAQQRSLRRPATLRIRVRVLLLATTCAEVSRRVLICDTISSRMVHQASLERS